MSRLVQPDMFKINEDEAVELVIHHLRMAAVFFQSTPEDSGQALVTEYERLVKRDNIDSKINELDVPVEWSAVRSFIKKINAAYEQLKKDA